MSPQKKLLSRLPRLPALAGLLLAATAVYTLLATLYTTNAYGFFPVGKVLRGAALILPLWLGLVALAAWLQPRLANLRHGDWRRMLLASLIVGLLLLISIPAPSPALAQPHTLDIFASGPRNLAAEDSFVWLEKARSLDGALIELEQFSLQEGWEMTDGKLVSRFSLLNAAHLEGTLKGGVALYFRAYPAAGEVSLTWDGQVSSYDLYSDFSTTFVVTLRGNAWEGLSAGSKAIHAGFLALHLLGLSALALATILVVRLDLLRWGRFSLSAYLPYLLVFGLYLAIKLSFLDFNGPSVYRDTTSYVFTAQAPLNSLDFWAGVRSFSLPLFYKSLGVTVQNYQQPAVLARIGLAQLWVSVLCWGSLALVVARLPRRPWVRLAAFGLMLFFSLNLEVSLWDAIPISESFSFSLMALLMAGWLAFLSLPPEHKAPPVLLGAILLVTALYTFVRDSNVYFVCMAAGAFFLAALVRPALRRTRLPLALYLSFAVLLLFASNWALGQSIRLRIHIYDQLDILLPTRPDYAEYILQADLPLADEVAQAERQFTPQYEPYFFDDPQKERLIAAWADENGRNTYVGYLLADPLSALTAPFQQIRPLVNGNNLEYGALRFTNQPIPRGVANLSAILYPRANWLLWLNLALLGGGTLWFLCSRRERSPGWLVVFAVLLSMYPLMFIVWHGNPLEIERHAAQIGVQFRLAGWLALILLAGEAGWAWPTRSE